MKTRNTGILLLIASIYWILFDLYSIIQRFVGDSAQYWKEKMGENLALTFLIIIPIALLIFAINLITVKRNSSNEEIIESLDKDSTQNISIGEWIVNLLITIIPLVGFIFTIIWATDNTNKIRRNWAIASLIWMGITLVLSIFISAVIFSVSK